MKRRRKRGCLGRCIGIQILISLFCHVQVLGLSSVDGKIRNGDQHDYGTSSLGNKGLQGSQTATFTNTAEGYRNVTNVQGHSVKKIVTKRQDISLKDAEDLYHAAYSLLEKMLKEKNKAKDNALRFLSYPRRNVTRILKNKTSRKVGIILGQSPQPSFKTRQNTLFGVKSKNTNMGDIFVEHNATNNSFSMENKATELQRGETDKHRSASIPRVGLLETFRSGVNASINSSPNQKHGAYTTNRTKDNNSDNKMKHRAVHHLLNNTGSHFTGNRTKGKHLSKLMRQNSQTHHLSDFLNLKPIMQLNASNHINIPDVHKHGYPTKTNTTAIRSKPAIGGKPTIEDIPTIGNKPMQRNETIKEAASKDASRLSKSTNVKNDSQNYSTLTRTNNQHHLNSTTSHHHEPAISHVVENNFMKENVSSLDFSRPHNKSYSEPKKTSKNNNNTKKNNYKTGMEHFVDNKPVFKNNSSNVSNASQDFSSHNKTSFAPKAPIARNNNYTDQYTRKNISKMELEHFLDNKPARNVSSSNVSNASLDFSSHNKTSIAPKTPITKNNNYRDQHTRKNNSKMELEHFLDNKPTRNVSKKNSSNLSRFVDPISLLRNFSSNASDFEQVGQENVSTTLFATGYGHHLPKVQGFADTANKTTSNVTTPNQNKNRQYVKKLTTKLKQNLGNVLISQEIVMELGQKKDKRPALKESSTCLTSDILHNHTMSSGLQAGYYIQQENVPTMDKCIYHCCARKRCNVAFMIKGNCFLIECSSKTSCQSRPAHTARFFPRLAYITHKDQYANAVTKESLHGGSKAHCNHHSVVTNMTFQNGLDAGRFVPHGEMATFQDCANLCCNEADCDVVLMVDKLCYSIRCKSKDSCKPVERRKAKGTTSIGFVSRGYEPPLVDVSYLMVQLQDHYSREREHQRLRADSCSKSSIPTPVYTNVKFHGGLNAGRFTDIGQVSGYEQCAKHCCQDGVCNAALTINNNCFLVACKTYEGCSTYPAPPRSRFHSHVVYMNWDEPRNTVFTKGNILYKTLGCWQEDESLQRMLSLEGTDQILHGSYKLRSNAVEKCAIAALKRQFKVFAIHNGGECRGSSGTQDVYKKNGTSNNCYNSSGGHYANHVYYFTNNGTVGDLGCWNAIQNDEGFTTLESTDGRIVDNYKVRSDSFLKCAEATMKQRFTLFALRDGGQCLGGYKTITKYKKYGVSKHCKNGKGSHASKNVYQIVGTTNFHQDRTNGKPLELSLKDNQNIGDNNPQHSVPTSDESASKTHAHVPYVSASPEKNILASPVKNILASPVKNILANPVKNILASPVKNILASPVKNATFVQGMKAGVFTTKGAVRDMKDCIQYCGKERNCSAAFMIQKYCFTVQCFTKQSCKTRKADVSAFQPKVSFITHRHPSFVKPASEETPQKKCQARKIYQNVTLFGGIKAGNFTDLGQQKNMDGCISHCCSRKRCDVAFMLGNDCYGVTCKTKQLCGTKPAKHVDKYKPRIAYVELSQKLDKKESLSSCWNETILFNHTLSGGINAGVFYSNGNTETMATCMKYCCQQDDCDVAFLIDQGCYTVRCRDREQCKARKARESRYLPQIAYKYGTTFSHLGKKSNRKLSETNKSIAPSVSRTVAMVNKEFSDNSNGDGGETKPLMELVQEPHSCKASPVHYNVTLKMGMHSGQFTKLGRAEAMKDCIEMGCKESVTDAVFMFGKLCYAVKCYNADLCQTRPAFVTSIDNLNINPAIAFLNKATNEHRDYARSEIEKRCVGTTVRRNVTLLGGEHAGHLTDNGERTTIEECISACCDTPSCDVAFMTGRRCYSVECVNETLCQAVTSEVTTSNKKPIIAYVARSHVKSAYDVQDIALSSSNQCPLEAIENLKVHRNKTLFGGFESGNYTFLGRTNEMTACMEKCCRLGKCDVAYSIDGNCYGIECFSDNLCSIEDRVAENIKTEISIIKSLKAKTSTSRFNYILPMAGGFAVIVIVGWIYLMRKKTKKGDPVKDKSATKELNSDVKSTQGKMASSTALRSTTTDLEMSNTR